MSNKYWINKRIVVTGGSGFLGSYLVKELTKRGVKKIIIPRSQQYNLRKEKSCLKITKNIQIVFHLAGNVGGIGYNQKFPGTLFYDNIMMGVNLIEACRFNLVGKLVVVGTICAYPKFTPTPFKEANLWNGYPEETNAPYGIAKKALIVQGQAYHQQYSQNIINPLLVNLYGPGDHFDPENSHVIPAMIKKFFDAKISKASEVVLWGTGTATREFFYVEDAARALVDAAEEINTPEPINLGVGTEISIKNLAEQIKELVEYSGNIVWDSSKPDGQPRRLLDITKAKQLIHLKPKTDFKSGLIKTIEWYKKHLVV
jgi:GDP-L-fucose synthase